MNRSGLKTVSDSQANSMNGRMSMGVQRGPRKPDAASRRSMIPVAPSRGLAYSNSNASQESYRDSGSSHAGYARQSMATGRRRSATRGEIQPPKKDRRSTGFGHHQSSMAMSRRSSIYGERSANKDTRPLSDKEYRKQCCAHMFRYLTTNGYSHPISIKLLTQPMMKDFLRIFQFLYTQLDNGYKFPENNTERTIPEVIILMKGVRYPFVLKQSSLLAFTPMEWPSLLGALHWLVELCQYNEGIGPAPYFYSVSEFDEGVPRDAQAQHVFEYVSKAYASFMLGTGDDDDDDGTDLTLFSRRKDSLLERKQQIDQSIDRLKNESVRYTQGPTPLQEATQMKADCESDMRKFVRVIQDYERKLMSRQKKLAEKTALVEQARKEAAQLQAESSHLNNVLANQELSPTDVLRINMDRAHLKKSLEDAQKQKEDSDMKLFEREKEITLATQEIHRKIYAYHELAGSIGVVPSSAKNAAGMRYELEYKSSEPEPERNLLGYLKDTITPALQKLKLSHSANIREVQNSLLEAQEEHEQVNEDLTESNNRLNDLRNKLHRLEAQYRDKKDIANSTLRSLQMAEDELEEQVTQMDIVYHDGSLQRLQAQYEDQVQRQVAERNQMIPALYASLNDAVSLKEHVSDQLDQLNKMACAAINDIMSFQR